ncbi:MAG TPA: GH1 family beta-glucosidase [Sphingomonas sp.]
MIDRRMLLEGGVALGGTLALPAVGAMASPARGKLAFPRGFRWGTATAAYQIEGAVDVDGRGPSIWDTFSHTPGKTKNGDTGDVACDSYRRWREDVALIKAMGLKSYRFSVAWPRIQADGTGPANQRGLDHYSRLVDALLAAGIRPLPTLYHWDLPQALEDRGGWPNRDTAHRFTDYAAIMARALGDRVPDWCVFNEPKTFTGLGYEAGAHAPGRRDEAAFLRSTHVVNLAYGLAYRAMKAVRGDLKIGNALDVSAGYAATDNEADRAAVARWDKFNNLWFLEPALTGRYPTGVLPEDRLVSLLDLREGDAALLKAAPDWVGINFYSPSRISAVAPTGRLVGDGIKAEWAVAPSPSLKTDIGWDVYPPAFQAVLQRVAQVTREIPIEITENGASYNIAPGPDGRIQDAQRIAYLDGHLRAVHAAIAAGVPIRGYHQWSLLDNFEWAEGYTQRFGIVWTDYADAQKRTPKASAGWYAAIARANALPALKL